MENCESPGINERGIQKLIQARNICIPPWGDCDSIQASCHGIHPVASHVRLFLQAILLITLFSCSSRPELSEKQKETIVAEVREMLQQYDDDIRKNGLMAEFAYLDSSAEFFWVPPGYSSPLSYDSVAIIIRRNAATFRLVDNVWDSLRVIPHSELLATFTGTISSRMIDTAWTSMDVSLIETGLAIKRSDGWKILSGQTAVLH